MGVTRRVDSIQELGRKKTNAQLAQENEALRGKVASLDTQLEDTQLEDTQLALCDVYEALLGGES